MINIRKLEHLLNGTKPYPECKDFYKEYGAIEGNGFACPKCGHDEECDDPEGYYVDNEKYPKYFNDGKYSTIDGTFYIWTELHKCTKCGTLYWFVNSN